MAPRSWVLFWFSSVWRHEKKIVHLFAASYLWLCCLDSTLPLSDKVRVQPFLCSCLVFTQWKNYIFSIRDKKKRQAKQYTFETPLEQPVIRKKVGALTFFCLFFIFKVIFQKLAYVSLIIFIKNSSAVTPDSSSDMNAVWPQVASLTGRHLKPNRYLKKNSTFIWLRDSTSKSFLIGIFQTLLYHLRQYYIQWATSDKPKSNFLACQAEGQRGPAEIIKTLDPADLMELIALR